MTPECWDLITKLICAPDQRLGKGGIEEIKQHPFFRGLDFERIKDSNPPFIPNVRLVIFFAPCVSALLIFMFDLQLADELDTSYFGMEDDDVEETTESIDALLDKAILKSNKQQNETTLSTIFSHKDSKKTKKLTEEQGTAAADLTIQKEGEAKEVMFTSSTRSFDFAGFGYKHDEIMTTPAPVVGPLKDISALRSSGSGTTPKTSPRGTVSSPTTPRVEIEHALRENGTASAPVTPGSSTITKSPRDSSSKISSKPKTPRGDGSSDMMIRSQSSGNIRPATMSRGSPGSSIDHPLSPKQTPPDSPRHSGSDHESSGKKKGHKRQASTTIVVSPRADGEPPPETSRVDDSIVDPANQSSSALSKIKKRLSAIRSKFKNSNSGASSDMSSTEDTTTGRESGRDSSRNSPMHVSNEDEDEQHKPPLVRKNSGPMRSRSSSIDHSSKIVHASPILSPLIMSPAILPVAGRARSGSVGFDARHTVISEAEAPKAAKRMSEGRHGSKSRKLPRAESEAPPAAPMKSPPPSRSATSTGAAINSASLTPEAARWKERILQKAATPAAPLPTMQEEELARQLRFRERILAKAAMQQQPKAEGSPSTSSPGSPNPSPPGSTTVSPSPSLSSLSPSTRHVSKKGKKSPRPSFAGEVERSTSTSSNNPSPTDSPVDLSPRDVDEKRRSVGRAGGKKRSNSHATKMVTSPVAVASLISLPGTPLESPENSPREAYSQPGSPRFIKTSVINSGKRNDRVVHATSSPHLPPEPLSEFVGRPRRGTIASTTTPMMEHLDVKETKKEKRRSEGRMKRDKRRNDNIPAIVEDSVAETHTSPPHGSSSPKSPKRDDGSGEGNKSSPDGSSKHRIVIR